MVCVGTAGTQSNIFRFFTFSSKRIKHSRFSNIFTVYLTYAQGGLLGARDRDIFIFSQLFWCSKYRPCSLIIFVLYLLLSSRLFYSQKLFRSWQKLQKPWLQHKRRHLSSINWWINLKLRMYDHLLLHTLILFSYFCLVLFIFHGLWELNKLMRSKA